MLSNRAFFGIVVQRICNSVDAFLFVFQTVVNQKLKIDMLHIHVSNDLARMHYVLIDTGFIYTGVVVKCCDVTHTKTKYLSFLKKDILFLLYHLNVAR